MIFWCSRNARPPKALVGRAQWEDQSAPIPEEKASELGGSIHILVIVRRKKEAGATEAALHARRHVI